MNKSTGGLNMVAECLLRAALLLACMTAMTLAQYAPPVSNRITQSFNTNWKYFQGDATGANASSFSDGSWSNAVLPHYVKWITPEDESEYLGIGWYRKHFTLPSTYQGRKVFVEFEGAMQWAQVWVNDVLQGTHEGGYMGFVFDITKDISFTQENVIAVKIDTRPNANWGPGKSDIDFRYYGGIYRDAWLHITDPVHVTNPLFVEKVAGGGVFVSYPAVTASSATVSIKTDVVNEGSASASCTVVSDIVDATGAIAGTVTASATIAKGTSNAFSQTVIINNPKLWSHLTPNLYTVHSTIKNGSTVVDYAATRIGIRRIAWTVTNGIQVNGASYKLRGTNYHQDIYGLGNAIPNSAIFHDLKLIKEAGFDFVRCCHYPHDPAFYDACDSLGIMVMNALSGWHNFPNTTAFNNNTFKECRDMVRRDRNHPSTVIWETSLNESSYSNAWAQSVHDYAHAEYPGDQMFTNGLHTTIFDVFSDAAANLPKNTANTGTRPVIISEYGDWEYGGGNSTSRVKRESSDAALLTQVANHQNRMNIDLGNSWFSVDCAWAFGDDGSESFNGMFLGGVVDFYRLPKFSCYFYRSQRDATESIPGVFMGPMVYIANTWQQGSPTSVKVFSNCDSVSLYRNGTLVATRAPDTDTNSNRIGHPPFTFTGVTFSAGTIKAEGKIKGTIVATHTRTTPGSASAIKLRPISSDPLIPDGSDARLVWIDVVDANGTIVPTSSTSVSLSVTVPAMILGPATVTMKGGQLATWVRSGSTAGSVTLTAQSSGLTSATLSLSIGGTTAVYPALSAAGAQAKSPSAIITCIGNDFFLPPGLPKGERLVTVYDLFGKKVTTAIIRDHGVALEQGFKKGNGIYLVR